MQSFAWVAEFHAVLHLASRARRPCIVCMSSAHHLHIVRVSSAHACVICACTYVVHTRTRHPHIVRRPSAPLLIVTVGPELSFTVTGICYWMEFVAGMLNWIVSYQIWTLFTSHLHMYMSSAYYLSICVLCAYFLQWSLISSFLTNNANVIYMSSLLLFIDPYMLYAHIHIICYVSFTFLIYLITCNLVSAYCLHTHMSSAHHPICHLHCYSWSAWAWTIFYCDRNLLLNGICGRNVELFHFRIM